jgi:hypothetical protein
MKSVPTGTSGFHQDVPNEAVIIESAARIWRLLKLKWKSEWCWILNLFLLLISTYHLQKP